MDRDAVTLEAVLEALEEIAPLEYAEEWDNAGLLLEPVPAGEQRVDSVVLTIDLTQAVVEEARELGAQLVVTYHPLIFRPFSLLTQADPRHRTVLQAVRAGMAVYSPHTALDAAPGGVNDWLADGLAPGRRVSIRPWAGATGPDRAPDVGQGRLLELEDPLPLQEIVDRVKAHLGLEKLRLAAAPGHDKEARIGTIALCAGAGANVVTGTEAQLYLTGEMRHHDVLAATEAGRSILLCEHTNTERGYLEVLRDRIRVSIPDTVRIHLSERDREPLWVV